MAWTSRGAGYRVRPSGRQCGEKGLPSIHGVDGVPYPATMSLLFRNLLFTLVVPASVGVYVPLWLARDTPRNSGVILAVVVVPFALASGMYAWSIWNFALRGRGTPLPLDAPKRLVIQGPYQYTRNPMYVALLCALLGWLLLYPRTVLVAYTVGVATSVSLFVIGYEEPHLRRLFGTEYDAYRSRVPRWLPRIPRRPDT